MQRSNACLFCLMMASLLGTGISTGIALAKPSTEANDKSTKEEEPAKAAAKSTTKSVAKTESTSKADAEETMAAVKNASSSTMKTKGNSTSKAKEEKKEEKLTGPGATAALNEEGYQQIVKLKKNKDMKTFVKRLVKNMSLVIIQEGGLDGMVPFYSGVKSKQSFFKLKEEIMRNKDNVCEGWVSDKTPPSNWTGFTAPLNEEGYIAIARKHNDSHMEKFIERTIVDLNYEITDVSGLLGLSPFHSCAKGTKHFVDLQKELMTLGSRPGQWLRLKGTSSGKKPKEAATGHVADKTLQREKFEKEMKAKREKYNADLAAQKEKQKTAAKMDSIKASSGKPKASASQTKSKVSLLQQEQRMQQEILMMKATREAYDRKLEQERKMQREFLMMKAAREAYDKKVEEEKRLVRNV